MLLPVHPSEYPEGLEDNYGFTDGHCDGERGDHSLVERMRREAQKERSNPLGTRTLMTTGVTQIQIPL